MINDNLKNNIEQSVETVMHTVQDLCKLVFDDKKCTWKPSNEEGETYSTSCGRLFTFIEAGVKENDFIFCCYCGCEIIESK